MMPVRKVETVVTANPQPVQRVREESIPIRPASFEQDVKPFANSIPGSVACIVIGLSCVVVSVIAKSQYQIPWLLYFALPISIALIAYGGSRLFIQWYLMQDYLSRQWQTTADIEDYHAETQENTFWLHLDDNQRVLLPEEPRPNALIEFAMAYKSGEASFSQLGGKHMKGAADFGYSKNNFDELRDCLLRNNLALWRNEKYHEQGVRLTQRGHKAMEAAAESGTVALEKFVTV